MKMLFHHLLESQARLRGATTALVYKRGSTSYRDLWETARSAAHGLRELGIQPHDRVAVYLEKRIETVAAMFAASAAGAVFVPVNPLLRPQQTAYILRDCDVRILVTSPERLEALSPAIEECPDLETVVLVQGDGTSPGRRTLTWDELGVLGRDVVEPPRTIDADMAAILYTSGSTGKPKGVVLSHRNLIVGAESVSHYIGNVPDDRILALLPLSFDAGLSQITTGFNVGATVVLMNYLLARDVVRTCEREAITGLTCVPPLWIKLANETWPASVGRQLRYFANTGGHMPRPLLDRLRAMFPEARPYLMYGLTEAFRSTYLDPAEIDRRPDSIGKAIPNAQVMVVREDGQECEPGEPGELVHRGALVSMGYWNAPELTAKRFKQAPGKPGGAPLPEMAVWSGDLARTDEDGFIYFLGRNDEMIKTSGYRVSPTEVEEVVFQTGLISEAAAIGLPDDELGQIIAVVVAPLDGERVDTQALTEACRKMLPLYMVPSVIHEWDTLPRNPNGKIDRTRIRADLLAGNPGAVHA